MKCGVDFKIGYSPERIMTGFCISRLEKFPKVVGGVNKDSSSSRSKTEFYKCSTFVKGTEKRV